MLEMADSCNQGQVMNGDASSSDDDSVSLLCNLDACQSRGPAEGVEMRDLNSQVDNKVQKKDMEAEMPPKSAEIQASVKTPNKIQIHRRDAWGESLLHKACKRKDLARVKVLIQAGIGIDVEDHGGWTALHEACAVGDEAVVEELLKAGAKVNVRSSNGVTPLHDAVYSGHYKVLKLLLQYGSDPSDVTVGGLGALDVTEKENITELLSTFQTCARHLQPSEPPAQSRQAAPVGRESFDGSLCDTTSEDHCYVQLPCRSSVSVSTSHRDNANVQCRESGDREGAREPADIQRKTDATTDHRSHSEAVTLALEEMRRKQTEISTWPLTGPEDAGRYRAALTQIQDVLIEVLNKQQLEKDNLAHTCRRVSSHHLKHALKSRLVSLASRQRTLVEIIQEQIHLEELYVTVKARRSTHPPNGPGGAVMSQQLDHFSTPASIRSSKAGEGHSCNQNGQRRKSQRGVRQTSLFRSAPPNGKLQVPRPAAALHSQRKKILARINVLRKKASSSQSCTPQAASSSQHTNFQIKRNKALIQTSVDDKSRRLSELIQRGVLPSGSSLQLLLKSLRHLSLVQADGSIRDCKGKLHKTPERWLESILGNNIPVSSTYAWDKVMFRGKPLAYHLSNTEADADTTPTCPADNVQHGRSGSAEEESLADADTLNHLRKTRVIHLVNHEGLLPNAVLDRHWEKLLRTECDDWGDELS